MTDERLEEIIEQHYSITIDHDMVGNVSVMPLIDVKSCMKAAIEADREERKNELLNRIGEIKKDECLSYKSATVFVNAPLALIQCAEGSKLHLLEDLAGITRSELPLPEAPND